MKAWNYTLDKYSKFLKVLQKSQYPVVTVRDYLEGNFEDPIVAIMRHDVDRLPGHALAMGKMEEELGIKSTYYFRKKWFTFNNKIIKELSDMGHEIGYHYETLAQCKGDFEAALNIFRKNLSAFRALAEIKTVSMHGSPLSKYDNSSLLKKYDPSNFGLTGDAVLSMNDFSGHFFTDAGRNCSLGKRNVRDKIEKAKTDRLNSTDVLINWIEERIFDKSFYISLHPARWATSTLDYLRSTLFDCMANTIKLFVDRYAK